ncbi:VOC family protein [Microbacterium testaceum]|uniref:VOC family protein n=1 Tax=Microbacterium testaceum TaxID=2033 RepID=UPI000734EB6E|nr:VOC family protein [Microbacterium testaceum]KTS07675.1 glyoxalase/bleomycin resistance protein/dioxygenase [Microbacterium testaceum]
MSDTNTVNYFEIGTPDPEAARAFYGQLFGWRFAAANPGGYAAVNENAGGLWDTSQIGGEAWAVFYVEVADIRATLQTAIEQGAETVRPLVDNGTILFAHLADPAGNRFGVWQRKLTA